MADGRRVTSRRSFLLLTVPPAVVLWMLVVFVAETPQLGVRIIIAATATLLYFVFLWVRTYGGSST